MRNTYALLIAGDEERHVNASIQFRNYLTNEAKFKLDRIWAFVDGETYYVLDKVRYFLEEAKAKNPNKPVVIAYNGHGVEGGITPSTLGQNSFISYEDLGSQLCHHDGGILFINNCCFLGSCIPVFRDMGILPKRGSVITSAGRKQESYGEHFQNTVQEFLLQKKSYQNRKIVVKPRLRYKTGIEFHKQKFNPVTGKWENTGKVRYDYRTAPAITQHPQRCGLDLDHLLFPQ